MLIAFQFRGVIPLTVSPNKSMLTPVLKNNRSRILGLPTKHRRALIRHIPIWENVLYCPSHQDQSVEKASSKRPNLTIHERTFIQEYMIIHVIPYDHPCDSLFTFLMDFSLMLGYCYSTLYQ